MSNKGKVLSIIAIVVGVGLIPAGVGLNMIINNETARGVPDALLGIQEEMIPEINETLKTMAIPDVLSGIYIKAKIPDPIIITQLMKNSATPVLVKYTSAILFIFRLAPGLLTGAFFPGFLSDLPLVLGIGRAG